MLNNQDDNSDTDISHITEVNMQIKAYSVCN